MSSKPSEVVFAVSSAPTDPACVFPYVDGLIKAPGPRKRGRPARLITKSTLKTGGERQSHYRNPKHRDADRFQFINFNTRTTKIDRAARKTIRRAAMLHRVQDTSEEGDMVPSIGAEQSIVVAQPLAPQSLYYSLGRADPFNTVPIQFEPYMHDLLVFYSTTAWKVMYSFEEKTGCNPMVYYWLPLAFRDAALLNVLIGCAASFRLKSKFFPGCPIFIRHMNVAMNIVNGKLASISKGEDVSDEILSVIATLAMIQKMTGSNNEWDIHMKGLRRLVDLRGGMRSLDDKPLIKSKIHRADLCGSVDITRQPYFNPHYERLLLNDFRNLSLPQGFKELDKVLRLDEQMENAIISLQVSLETMTTLHLTRNQSHAAQARLSLTSAQYALLSIAYDDWSCPKVRAQETCRLAILLFTATAFRELPSGVSRIVGRLIELLSDSETCKCLTLNFQTWALCLVAGSASLEAKKRCCLLLSDILSRMHIDTEEQIASVLPSFLREEALHQTHCYLLKEIFERWYQK